jgi:hypothetical protein
MQATREIGNTDPLSLTSALGVSRQRHAQAALYPEERTPTTHLGGPLTACLYTEARGKTLCRGTNPGL